MKQRGRKTGNIKTAARGGEGKVTRRRVKTRLPVKMHQGGVINSAGSPEERGNVDEWLIRMAERI